MTTAQPTARYGAIESARAGGSATGELHHHRGHDLDGVAAGLDRDEFVPWAAASRR